MKPKHLLMDLDGTIVGVREFTVRVEFIFRSVWAFRRYGGLAKGLELLKLTRQALEDPEEENWRAHLNAERAIQKIEHLLQVPKNEAERIYKEDLGAVFPKLSHHFYPVPGASDFIHWAKEKYPVTLATNPVWPIDIVKIRVRWAGVDPDCFESITHSESMHSCKPFTSYYQEILDQRGLKAEDCLMIGNDIRKDLPASYIGIPVYILGKQNRAEKIRDRKSKAPCYRGTYPALQKLLEDPNSISI